MSVIGKNFMCEGVAATATLILLEILMEGFG